MSNIDHSSAINERSAISFERTFMDFHDPGKCQCVYILFASTFEEIKHPIMYRLLLLILTISRINPESIACQGEDACKARTSTCKSGSECIINCQGKAACQDA
eukprot:568970_1